MKEIWNEHLGDIEEKIDLLPEVLIPTEIIYPTEAATGLQDFEDAVLEISAARNNNVQLKETAKANKAGLYFELKENLDDKLKDEIEWKDNDGNRIKAQDLVALSLIPLSALPSEKGEKYPVSGKIKNNQTMIFSSKGLCVKVYNEFMDTQNGIVEQVKDDRTKKIVDPLVISALSLVKKDIRNYMIGFMKNCHMLTIALRIQLLAR